MVDKHLALRLRLHSWVITHAVSCRSDSRCSRTNQHTKRHRAFGIHPRLCSTSAPSLCKTMTSTILVIRLVASECLCRAFGAQPLRFDIRCHRLCCEPEGGA